MPSACAQSGILAAGLIACHHNAARVSMMSVSSAEMYAESRCYYRRAYAPQTRARRRGVSFGRPQKLRPDQKTLALTLVQEGRSISEVARTFNVHPATIHRCLNAAQAT